eukprot:2919974-Amphidinium_carterae.1
MHQVPLRRKQSVLRLLYVAIAMVCVWPHGVTFPRTLLKPSPRGALTGCSTSLQGHSDPPRAECQNPLQNKGIAREVGRRKNVKCQSQMDGSRA